MSENPNPSQKTYHKKATGAALNTIKRHSKEHELKLFGSCFWYALVVILPSFLGSRKRQATCPIKIDG